VVVNEDRLLAADNVVMTADIHQEISEIVAVFLEVGESSWQVVRNAGELLQGNLEPKLSAETTPKTASVTVFRHRLMPDPPTTAF
jgi:hypothetical protein